MTSIVKLYVVQIKNIPNFNNNHKIQDILNCRLLVEIKCRSTLRSIKYADLTGSLYVPLYARNGLSHSIQLCTNVVTYTVIGVPRFYAKSSILEMPHFALINSRLHTRPRLLHTLPHGNALAQSFIHPATSLVDIGLSPIWDIHYFFSFSQF